MGHSTPTTAQLDEIAKEARREIVTMIAIAESGHPGGSLSSIDILVALYYSHLKNDPHRPHWSERDRFVLSKGHGAPALYAVLAMKGYFDRSELKKLRQFGSLLRGHPVSTVTPGVEVCTGSLGQGLSQANGIAMALRLDKSASRVYCLIGDGECQEGMIWEAAMSASHHKLDNLCAILDCNTLQIDGAVKDVKNIEPIGDKWRAFGWNVLTTDGHSIPAILDALKKAGEVAGKPTIIIANTVKGKGVSFMEGKSAWHGSPPSKEQLQIALSELA